MGPAILDDDDDNLTLPLGLFMLVIFVPLIVVLLLAFTPVRDWARVLFGRDLPTSDSLVVYEVVCSQERNFPLVEVIYHTQQPSELHMEYNALDHVVLLSTTPGTHNISVSLYDTTECPATITLSQPATGQKFGYPVEVLSE
jgi:hypothetical protein